MTAKDTAGRDGKGEDGRARTPEATQIVDLFYAREHLHDLARHLEFMLLDRNQSPDQLGP